MDHVWLREYEIMLSSNRRTFDTRPVSADISNNRVKKGRPAKHKKKKDNVATELDVARELLTAGTDADEYDRHFPERQEKLVFHRKLEHSKPKQSTNKVHVAFKKLTTFQEFKDVENRRNQCFITGDSKLFHELYPHIEHHKALSPTKKKTAGAKDRPKSSPMVRTKSVPYEIRCVVEEDPVSRPDRPPAQIEKKVAHQAIAMWKSALTALRLRGKEIVYEDVAKFSKRWKRSESLRDKVVYISILLGLKSGDPKMTQRSVFRELYTLLKFFREANPLTLPKRRIIKANNHYDNCISKRKVDDTEDTEDTNDNQKEEEKENAFEIHILRWIDAIQAIFAIILNAKHRHDIMNSHYDEKICNMEALHETINPTSTTPFKHLKSKGKGAMTPKQKQHQLAKLSPTGTWSTRLTHPGKMTKSVMEEKSMSEGLNTFDSTSVQSFVDVSNSMNIPLEDMSLEYSPDKSVSTSPLANTHYRNTDDEPYERYFSHNACNPNIITSPIR
mmetsp:Transcript_17979/g.30080  ORF Transcript_17979/g.30080 Transcript_17979/m.30080 type:complete len:502 (-) Transcript_17979:110-1615(-)